MNPWNVIICDDDETIHQLSAFTLDRLTFRGQPLNLLHAYGSDDCINMLKEHSDTALILLDMIMEEDNSGITVLKRIREELQNHRVRIILRSGQGDSSEIKELFEDYDLSDYRDKTQLSSKAMEWMIFSALSCYSHLKDN